MAVKACSCPLGAVIPDLVDLDCPTKFGQIGKIAFQIKDNPFLDITDNAEWVTALAALDSTKVQVTPILHAQESTPPEPVTVGGAGDNTVYDGTIEVVSEGIYQINFSLRNPSPAVLTALKEYECEVSRLGIYMGGSDFVISKADSSAIPVSSLYIQSSPALNGNTDANIAQVQMVLDANWFADSLVSKIDFNFTSLVNA
tara:strand:+ start:744 stop:1343 length:600 start_codon:yes stop_codon:yes gene_type:complete